MWITKNSVQFLTFSLQFKSRLSRRLVVMKRFIPLRRNISFRLCQGLGKLALVDLASRDVLSNTKIGN